MCVLLGQLWDERKQAGCSCCQGSGSSTAVLTRRMHVVAAGRERGLGRGLRLCHHARAVAVHGQRLAGPRARLVPVERRARRGAGTARVKRRRSVESAAPVASDTAAAQVYWQRLLHKQTSFLQATLQTLKAKFSI